MNLKPSFSAVHVLIILIAFRVSLPAASAQTSQKSSQESDNIQAFQLKSFKSHGKEIRYEWFEKDRSKTKPVVILLYGQSGVESQNGYLRYFAGSLAKDGFAGCLLHFFDRSSIKRASSKQMGMYFSDWLSTISDCINHLKVENPERKFALLGHSLGAQLALIEASRNKNVNAVVELSGSLVFGLPASAKLPPVLILHGDKDKIVPIQKEKLLEQKLKSMHSYYEKKIYPGQKHSFDLDPALDAIERSSDFLQRML